ncbi:MAG: hypothetical protein QOD41_1187, partial [Cryptosporangiaceae bacterium]|nr:hypothetical protein [Cryptosporangiaceae bacterium]
TRSALTGTPAPAGTPVPGAEEFTFGAAVMRAPVGARRSAETCAGGSRSNGTQFRGMGRARPPGSGAQCRPTHSPGAVAMRLFGVCVSAESCGRDGPPHGTRLVGRSACPAQPGWIGRVCTSRTGMCRRADVFTRSRVVRLLGVHGSAVLAAGDRRSDGTHFGGGVVARPARVAAQKRRVSGSAGPVCRAGVGGLGCCPRVGWC